MSGRDAQETCRAAAAAVRGEARSLPGGGATVAATLEGVVATAQVGADGAVVVSCAALGAGDLVVRLYPEGLASGLGKVFGAQDVEVGASRFDDRYMIKASDEGLARLWLDHEVRRAIDAADPEGGEGGVVLRLEFEEVSLRWGAAPLDAGRVEGALRAAAALGRRSADLLARLRVLAVAIGGSVFGAGTEDLWRPGGAVGMTVALPGGGEAVVDHVSVGLESRRPTLFTRLATSRAARDARPGRAAICRPDTQRGVERLLGADLSEFGPLPPDVSARYWVGVDRWGALKPGLLDSIRAALLAAMPVAVALDLDRVTIFAEGFVDDPERLRRALALADAIGGAARPGVRGRSATPAPRRAPVAAARPRSFAETWSQTALSERSLAADALTARAEVDGVEVVAEERSSLDRGHHLVVAAEAPDATGLTLALAMGRLGAVEEALGARDVALGDEGFDSRFVVSTDDPGYAKIWLGPEVRKAIAETLVQSPEGWHVDYAFRLEGARATAESSAVERSPDRLEAVVRAVAAIAGRGRAIVARGRALAAELDGALVGDPRRWDPEGGVPFTIGQGDEAVTVSQGLSTALGKRPQMLTQVHRAWPTPRDDRFLICKHARLKAARRLLAKGAKVQLERVAPDDAYFGFLLWAGGEDADALAARLDERTRSQLALAGPEAVVSDRQEIKLWFAGFVDDADRLRLVLRILRALGGGDLTSGPAGPYR